MRMAVDLPAPFAPRKPKISPRATSKLMPSDSRKRAEPARQIADEDRRVAHQRPSALWSRARASSALARARVRSSSACNSAVCASSTSMFVATPALNRSAITRRASAADRTPTSAASIAAVADVSSAIRCRTSTSTPASKSRSRASTARRFAAASAVSARTRPPSNSDQRTFTPMSHDGVHLSWMGKILRFGRDTS